MKKSPHYALVAYAALLVLAACNGRTAAPLLPAGGPLLPLSGTSSSLCPTILVISPRATFSDIAVRDLRLTETLEKRTYRLYGGCEVVSRTHPAAKWSNTGGSLQVENGGAQAIFSASKFGIYGISATSGTFGASAVVVMQKDDKLKSLAHVSGQATGSLLLDSSGALYGVTARTVYRLAPSASKPETIYSFPSGYTPFGPLIADKSGDLFGTTGEWLTGTAYELMRSGSGYTKRLLHRFAGKWGPSTGLVADNNGALYGTTDSGIVFKLAPTGSSYVYTVLHRFDIKYPGLNDLSGPVLRGDGSLYGTVEGNPYYGSGTYGFVYELQPKGSSFIMRTLYRFKGGTDGQNPFGGVVVDSKGVLYGTTTHGGTFGGGTIYDLTPGNSGFTEHILYSFDGLHGASPTGLTSGPNGMLFGVTNGGAGGNGIVFSVDRQGATRTIYFFEGPYHGIRPYFSPIADRTGALYGVWADYAESLVYKLTR